MTTRAPMTLKLGETWLKDFECLDENDAPITNVTTALVRIISRDGVTAWEYEIGSGVTMTGHIAQFIIPPETQVQDEITGGTHWYLFKIGTDAGQTSNQADGPVRILSSY